MRGAPTRMNSSTAISAAVIAAALLGGCERPRSPAVRIAVGGAEQMIYLPATLAQQLGFYEAEGVREDFETLAAGGAKALQALLGGSGEVVCGCYDHTLP